MDDFLQNYEVSGGKMKPSLPGSGPEKLQSLRLAMGRGERVTVEGSDQEGKDDDIYAVIEDNEKPERWDVGTVLSKSHNTRGSQSLIGFQSNVHEP
jgi:protein LTV1